MKKLSGIIIGIISLMAVSVGCQDIEQNKKGHNDKKQQFGQMNQKLKGELNLSESQEKKWDEIQLKYREEFKQLRMDEATARNERIEKGKAIAGKMDKEMLAILDDNQKETYKQTVEENRNKAKARYKEHKKGKTGKQSFIQMENELNLTEKQTGQWDAIQTDYQPKFKEIRESGQPQNEETKKEMIGLMEQKNTDIIAILNSDQQTIYSKFVEERKQMAKQRQNKK